MEGFEDSEWMLFVFVGGGRERGEINGDLNMKEDKEWDKSQTRGLR